MSEANIVSPPKINIVLWNELNDKDKEMAEVSFKSAMEQKCPFRRIATNTISTGLTFMFCGKDFYIDLPIIEDTYKHMIDDKSKDFKILILHYSIKTQNEVKKKIESFLAMRAFW